MDVRDFLWPVKDDVLVEFKFYYQEPTLGFKQKHELSSLDVEATFIKTDGSTVFDSKHTSGKSSGSLTAKGEQKTKEVKIVITYSFNDDYFSINQKLYFIFDNVECGHPKNNK